MTTHHVPIPYLRSFDRAHAADSYKRVAKIRKGGEPSKAYLSKAGVVRIRAGGAFGSNRSADWQAKAWNAALAGRWDSYLEDDAREARRRRIDRERAREAYARERVTA